MSTKTKTATVPIPGALWDMATPSQQMAMLQAESAKFAAAMHLIEFGGFQIVVVRDDGEYEVVFRVGEAPQQSIVRATEMPGGLSGLKIN